jgi:hypothetical protein
MYSSIEIIGLIINLIIKILEVVAIIIIINILPQINRTLKEINDYLKYKK